MIVTHTQVARLLRVERGLSKGDRVVLAFNFGLEFFVVFLGCLRAGIIAVPVYPPNPATLKNSLPKLQLIVDSCEPKLIVVDSSVNRLRLACKSRALAKGISSSSWPDLPYHCSDVEEGVPAATTAFFAGWLGGGSIPAAHKKCESFDDPGIKPEDVAFSQFASGSTSDPKGVVVTFANLEHNTGCIIRCAEMVRPTTLLKRARLGLRQLCWTANPRCILLSGGNLLADSRRVLFASGAGSPFTVVVHPRCPPLKLLFLGSLWKHCKQSLLRSISSFWSCLDLACKRTCPLC